MTDRIHPLVLATRNAGKTREIRRLLDGKPVLIRTLEDFGTLPPVVEDGPDFEENAVLKARFYARVLGYPTLADDSGLVVEALGGAPGVFSARYAGENATDAENNRKLLEEMKGKGNRNAAFVCILALAVPAGPALIYEGRCEGGILEEPKGSQGFGYDPLFYYPPLDKTFAQLTPEEKNRVSHRGRALQELAGEFDKVLVWLDHRLQESPFQWA